MSQDTQTNSDQAKGANPLVMVAIGVIIVALGVSQEGAAWTTPAVFAGLELDLAKTIVNIGVFLIFIQVLTTFFFVPLKEILDARNRDLESTFAEADDLRANLTGLKNDYEQRLAATEAQAREQIQAQISEAQNLRKTLMAEAGDRADELIRQAEQEIASERARALTDIRLTIVDLTLQATEKVLGQTVDAAVNRRLVNEFIDKVEVAS